MIQRPKGTYDVYGIKGKQILYIEKLISSLMEKYNYEYYRTPIFESSELFHRGVGETTDIVTKETYDFIDRSDRPMTLRPEGTAGICRSFVENKIYGTASLPVKTWYYGPQFRYERPQSGRFREFYQFGIEVLGCDNPVVDAEVITVPVTLYKLLGLKGIKVNVNSLGDKESRENYREALIKHFEPVIDTYCEDCKERFKKNPLRILDCKVDTDKPEIKNAPKTIDYLNDISKNHFNKVLEFLKSAGIEYQINPKIVRGLDYYTHTVFEIEADIPSFGTQNVLCGGGRYNGLIKNIGGPDIPGVGVALGMERLLSALEQEGITLPYIDNTDIYVIPLTEDDEIYAFSLVQELRVNGFNAELESMRRKLQNAFKQSDKLNSKYVIIIGENEKNSEILTIKENKTKEEFKIKREEIIEFLDENIS